ncbi:MAG: zinc ribbon domain-containing protein [Ruminococcus sp.]|nr:zinc ribbon domain-containing protein [Ruminococcus sp.]
MSQVSTPAAEPKKKGSAGKTFLSVIFFILILACAYILAKCMSMGAMNSIAAGQEVLGKYADLLGGGIADFLSGALGFWCAFSSVVLWFGLWIVTTKRIATAIRGLGVACSIAALAQIAGGLLALLLICVFSVESDLSAYKDALPSLFVNTCGDTVIFALSSMLIAAFGIFVCKLRKLPKKNQAKPAESAPMSEPEKTPEPAVVSAAAPQPETPNITNIDIDVAEPAMQPDVLSEELAGICHMCGTKNDTSVKFCGSCGAKLG